MNMGLAFGETGASFSYFYKVTAGLPAAGRSKTS